MPPHVSNPAIVLPQSSTGPGVINLLMTMPRSRLRAAIFIARYLSARMRSASVWVEADVPSMVAD